MARRSLIKDNFFPYHVTARSNNKEWFYLPQSECWNLFTKHLGILKERFRIEILAFVLMSNHFHLLLSTPYETLDKVMRYFMTETSKEIGRRSKRINHVYGGRYKWSFLPDAEAVAFLFKYIYRNPVKAGITERCEDYRFSTANIRGLRQIPAVERIDEVWERIPKNPTVRSDWLNSPTPYELEDLVRKAGRRTKFAFSKDKKVQLKLEQLRKSYLLTV